MKRRIYSKLNLQNVKYQCVISIFLTKLVLLLPAAALLGYCSNNEAPKVETISIREALNISDLKPSINLEKTFLSIAFATNFWDVDEDGNYYLLDIHNHRVMKYGRDLRFLNQFGGIGQEEDSLYYPNGIAVYNGNLFVMDQEGKKVKSFSLDGSLLSSFEIRDAYSTESILIDNDEIFLSVKYRSREEYNKNKLISVFSLSGKKLRDFGETVSSMNYNGHVMFNRVRLFKHGDRIFTPYNFWPIIRIFEKEKEIKRINLLEQNLDEIEEIAMLGKKQGVDTPQSLSSDSGVSSIIYCSGFSPYSSGEFYYVTTYDRYTKSIMYIIDELGKCRRKVIFYFKGKPLRINDIKFKSNNKYCIATVDQQVYLFKFK